MRAAGEVSLAMLQAAHAIRRERLKEGKGATLKELATRACVGYAVARNTVANLKRSGKLSIVGECKVAGRNRPAALYLPTEAGPDLVQPCGALVLNQALSTWGR